MLPAPASNTGHSENLDILRALAVMLVLADHVLETIAHKNAFSFHPIDWQLGRIGVLLFFVHTSLVLMQSLARLHEVSVAPAAAFVVKRFFRIYPLSVSCVLAIYLLRIPPLPFAEFKTIDLGTLASNIALTMNLLDSQLVLAPLWSLPIELQMYMFLPGLYALVAIHPFGRRALLAWVLGILMALAQPLVSERLSVLFFAPCFIAGIVAYTMLGHVRPIISGRLWMPFLAAVVCAYLLVETVLPGVHNPGPQWLLCAVVGLSIPFFRRSDGVAINRAGEVIARYSYGIYLFHCIALWTGCFALAHLPWAAQWLTASAVLVALCGLGYYLIEKPGIDMGSRLARRLGTSRRL